MMGKWERGCDNRRSNVEGHLFIFIKWFSAAGSGDVDLNNVCGMPGVDAGITKKILLRRMGNFYSGYIRNIGGMGDLILSNYLIINSFKTY